MKKTLTTTGVAFVLVIAGWAGFAHSQEDQHRTGQMPMMQMMQGESEQMPGMSEPMMARHRMMMQAELSPSDPTALLAMKDQLELTPEQVEQLQSVRQAAQQRAEAVLSEAQRQQVQKLPEQPASMMQMHQQMMQRMQQMDGEDGMQKDGMQMCPMCTMMNTGRGDGAATRPAGQVELDAEAQTQVDRLVSSYLTIQQRLAEDQLGSVAAQLAQLRQSAQALGGAADAQLQAKANAVAEAVQAQPENLKQARDAFKPLSATVIELVKIAPPSDQAATALHVANCPMAGADWLQTTEQIVNPYMGQRMLRCGSIQQTLKQPTAQTEDSE